MYFAKNLENREQTVALLENTQSYAKIPLFLGVDEEGGTVSRVGSNPDMGVPSVGDMRSLGKQQDPAAAYAAGQEDAKAAARVAENVSAAAEDRENG